MYYPVCIDLRGKNCLVVGGGEVAERKAGALLAAGGKVRVVSPEVTPALAQWAAAEKIELRRRPFRPEDIEGIFLAIAATDHSPLHEKIYRLCAKKNILLNVVDEPARCNFIVPSVVRRGKLLLAISTNGASPGLSKKIRRKLETIFGDEYAVFLEWMEAARPKLVKKLSTQKERKAAFEELIESPVMDLLAKGQKEEAGKRFQGIVNYHLKG